MIEVYLKKNADKKIKNGFSWVFANEAAKIVNNDKEKNGSIAAVYDYDGSFIGKGYINYLSKILVRIFIRKFDSPDDVSLFYERIIKANTLRQDIIGGDNYRAVYAEADELPAFIVDRYGDVLVVQFLSLGMDLIKQKLTDCLVKVFNPRCIYERSDAAVRIKEGLEPSCGILYGQMPDRVIISENDLKLSIDIVNGQKTGYFLDQKQNRYALRRYCINKDVLDCFSNSGGFALNAATVAKSVIAADISATALKNVEENAKLNGFTNITTIKADVFELLRLYKKQNKTFDVIILDPPAFTKSASEMSDAVRGYRDINILALKLLNSGGFLATSSCSQHVDMQLFERIIKEAAISSGKTVRLVEVKTQSPDHPVLLTADETAYLKFLVLTVS